MATELVPYLLNLALPEDRAPAWNDERAGPDQKKVYPAGLLGSQYS
jgi:hypothetical protein